jgi:hypothetical protein
MYHRVILPTLIALDEVAVAMSDPIPWTDSYWIGVPCLIRTQVQQLQGNAKGSLFGMESRIYTVVPPGEPKMISPTL